MEDTAKFVETVNDHLVTSCGNIIAISSDPAHPEAVVEVECQRRLGAVERLAWYAHYDDLYMLFTMRAGLVYAKWSAGHLELLYQVGLKPRQVCFLGPPLQGVFLEFETCAFVWGFGVPNTCYHGVRSLPQRIEIDGLVQWAIQHWPPSADTPRISLWPSMEDLVYLESHWPAHLRFHPNDVYFAYTDEGCTSLWLGTYQTPEMAVRHGIAPSKFEWTDTGALVVIHDDPRRWDPAFDGKLRACGPPPNVLVIYDGMLGVLEFLSALKVTRYYRVDPDYTIEVEMGSGYMAVDPIDFEISAGRGRMYSVNARFVALWDISVAVELVYAVRIDNVLESLRVSWNADDLVEVAWPQHKLIMGDNGPELSVAGVEVKPEPA